MQTFFFLLVTWQRKCCRNFKVFFFQTSNSKFDAMNVVHIPLTRLLLWSVPVVAALPFVLIVRQNGVGRLSGRVLGLNHRKIPHYVIIVTVTTDPEQETLKQFRAQESKTLQLTQPGVGMFPLFGPIQKLYM